jgi:hypothetical protein
LVRTGRVLVIIAGTLGGLVTGHDARTISARLRMPARDPRARRAWVIR